MTHTSRPLADISYSRRTALTNLIPSSHEPMLFRAIIRHISPERADIPFSVPALTEAIKTFVLRDICAAIMLGKSSDAICGVMIMSTLILSR